MPTVPMMSVYVIYYIFYKNSEMEGAVSGAFHKTVSNLGVSATGGITLIYLVIVVFILTIIYPTNCRLRFIQKGKYKSYTWYNNKIRGDAHRRP